MLTKKKIEKLTEPGLYGDERTLYLKVAKGGSKSWVQRIVIEGVRRDIGLGGYPTIGLDDARTLAIENRRKVTLGENILKPKQEAKVPTFQEAAEIVIAIHAPTWKPGGKLEQGWRSSLAQYVFPTLGAVKVSDVTAKEVHAIVSPLWATKHETALKVKRRIGTILKWSMVQGYRMDNPVDALGAALPKSDSFKKHFKMIPHAEVPAAIRTIHACGAFPTTILCFEFTVLCAVRPSEARLARWEEINLKERTWTVPAERMKMKKPHKVPLSRRALEILQEVESYREADHDLIFPGAQGGALSDNTVSKLCRENGIDGVPHGIARASFRSWCADQNVTREVAEACLAHAVGGVEGAYQRSDLFRQRAVVMERWSDYLTGKAPAKVVNLRG